MTHKSDAPSVALPADFDDQYQDWYKAVAGVFARVQRKDVADVPLDVWKKLVKTTYDGIDVNPLYTRADEVSEQAEPGVFPFVRGQGVSDADAAGWGVTERFGGTGYESAKATNEALLHALMNGTTRVVLDLSHGLRADELSTVLEKVLLEYVPVRLEAGADTEAAAEALYQVVDIQDAADKACLELGAAPLTAAVQDASSVDLDTAVSLAVAADKRPGCVRAVLVDGVHLSNQGASDAQEIGMMLAAAVDYVRALVDGGLSVEAAVGQLSMRLAVTDDQFNQIAKLRAFRGVWARVCEVLGVPEAAASTPQHVQTAPVMFSQRDPWVNMLRTTVAAFAGGVGGATDVEVLPFDAAVPGGLPNTSRSFATRIARNTNLLLLEESHLGFVVDPAGGSYYVEALTEELADKAWAVFQTIEEQGGYRKALESGSVRETLDATFEAVRKDIAHRVKKVTGINEFPNLGEQPLPAEKRAEPAGVRRFAAEFEALRNRSDAYLEAHGERPKAVLVPLGPLAKHNVRTGFATNLLASGGIEAVNPGQLVPGTDDFASAVAGHKIAVICGADPEYAETGVAAVKALRDTDVEMVLLAGAPKSFAEADEADRPDDYLNMTIDAAGWMDKLLTALGA
ncbi:methylmalonyl-CoA mutase family protein [Corynebacterium choanae]|uniref:Methylmalonyl-CoA mutase small subunit n=1 Tax=Corynebacterium choanae TaxID=1862358 RepID=A0A3G6JAS7_9CORY|nr:methylmalonyl-CoA mutase family protein [Corynebacterium choanae]AZA13590.1 Methylmalonyl-CoA mutase small subunit [Corynebacterium choanae]